MGRGNDRVAPSGAFVSHDKNVQDVYMHWCSQQLAGNDASDHCPNSLPCARYVSTGGDGAACRTELAEIRHTDEKTYWAMYNTIAQNYCTYHPTTAECACLMRNTNNQNYNNMKQGRAYNDGCWYPACESGDPNKMFITKEVAVFTNIGSSPKATQAANCPACSCTQTNLYYDDNNVIDSGNSQSVKCNDTGSSCS
jgi:hypothetical protein